MKTLYDKNYKYTEEAQLLDVKTGIALKPIFDEFVKKGYSPREISQIVQGTVTDFELENILGWNK